MSVLLIILTYKKRILIMQEPCRRSPEWREVPLQWAVSITAFDAPHFNEWGLGDQVISQRKQ
jgi:hypothetical protein